MKNRAIYRKYDFSPVTMPAVVPAYPNHSNIDELIFLKK